MRYSGVTEKKFISVEQNRDICGFAVTTLLVHMLQGFWLKFYNGPETFKGQEILAIYEAVTWVYFQYLSLLLLSLLPHMQDISWNNKAISYRGDLSHWHIPCNVYEDTWTRTFYARHCSSWYHGLVSMIYLSCQQFMFSGLTTGRNPIPTQEWILIPNPQI